MSGAVVLGYDGSPSSRAALRMATQLASATKRPLVVAFGHAPAAIGGDVADLSRAVREIGEQLTSDAVATVRDLDPSVDVSVEIVDGRPADAILAAGDKHDAYVLVVGGASGRGPVRGAILGSVTYAVVHRADRPVLVVPGDEDGSDT